MIGEKLLLEKAITLSQVRDILEERKKDKELNYEQDIALKYAKKFAKLTTKQTEKIAGELAEIGSLPPEMTVKIIDILPVKKEILEMLVPKGTQIPEADLAKVLEITKKHFKE